ncbi:FAD binding domain-containing protein [Sabulicella rubraurantiaca]|uniref:FAD binding domain-containing protein n=1 Tax=Sabulicella rubraurantiaca TaxID=2811429 RepID=UPI001A960F47|nr:xanthine dehydrogenase family protein subunit M [Sabulicella rubraurantiaca]
MKPPPFDYSRPTSLPEALALLGPDSKVIAGGQSLLPMLNFRLLRPSLLVDIGRIQSLRGLHETPTHLEIGATTSHRTLETHPLVAARFPVLAEAMRHVAHLAIRNRGTIGGSLSHADPAAEHPMLALLLDAQIQAAGPSGKRQIPARKFFQGSLTTALLEDEMVVAVRLPWLRPGTGWGFEEFALRAGDFATACAAALLRAGPDGRITEARLALMGVDETALRVPEAEALLLGSSPSAFGEAARLAQAAVRPATDIRASSGFRRHLVGVLVGRALEAAWGRAREGQA